MTRTLLIAGTASHVGKSTVAAGLCRVLAARDVAVAPFKAQNMSNNAVVVVRPDCDTCDTEHTVTADAASRWGEIGVSQFVQARAARITPTTDCNPVLLKPRGDGESQLVVQGRAVGHLSAGEYFENHWEQARRAVEESYQRLEADTDVVIAEGAGSIAEINLHDRDLANVETARFADAEILLLVDIERGGAFASVYGTIELLPADIRDRVVGTVITKFRGEASLLEPGIAEIESRTGIPVLGVIPYAEPGLPEEDSVALPGSNERGVVGADDGVPPDRAVTIAAPRLPHISNATDLEVLSSEPGVRIAYLPLERLEGPPVTSEDPLTGMDAVVIPGTKNTVDDLLTLRGAGFDAALRRFDGPIVGICGGYQMLGERLHNASLEGTGEHHTITGIGLLPVETTFAEEKHLERTTTTVDGVGPLAGASGTATGYEIHTGRTNALEPVDRPVEPSSARRANVLGTYLHGLFDNENVREAFLTRVYQTAGRELPRTVDATESSDEFILNTGLSPYDRAASLVATHVELTALGPPFERAQTRS